MALKVNREINLYGVTHKTPPRDSQYTIKHPPGPMPGPQMRDTRIEARESDPVTGQIGRNHLEDDEGNLCIGVQPGDETLGEFYLSIQFEGPSGKHKICMDGQNEVVVNTSAALMKIMQEMGFDGEVTIDGAPCPAHDAPPLKVIEAAQNIAGVSALVGDGLTVREGNKNKVKP